MANKAFEIQGSQLSIGGSNLEVATNGDMVIPGISRAGVAVAREVEHFDIDQTVVFQRAPVIVDAYRWSVLIGGSAANGWTPATFTAVLDDDGYIDSIEVNNPGTGYIDAVEAVAGDLMYAYDGADQDPINNFNANDWVTIPFYVISGAGDIARDTNNFGSSADLGDLFVANSSLESDSSGNFVNLDVNGDDWMRLGTYNSDKLQLITDYDGNTNIWEFSANGGLKFPDGTTQTTAYTGQSGGGNESRLYVAVNTDGRAFTSTDGTSWTEYTTSMTNVGRVAVGPDTIVYTANADDVSNGDGDALWYASASTPGTVTEVTGISNIELAQVKYFAGVEKFIAIGSDTNGLPIILYSSNGVDWTQVNLDSNFLTAFNSGAGYTGPTEFTDIETNGTGFLLTTSDINLGAFYTTDITTPMDQTNRIDLSGLGLGAGFNRIAYAAAGEYTGWHIMQNQGDIDDAWYYNSNTVPTSGTFSSFALNNIGSEFATEVNYEPQVSEVVFGAYNGITTIMVATHDGQILYWPAVSAGPWVSIPKPYTATDFNITQSNTATITFGNKSAFTNEKIVLSNCTPSGYNGTYYVGSDNRLYTDTDVSASFDSSGLGAFSSGTLTFSHGQYIDALHYSSGKFYAGNDDEEMFVSTNGGANWTLADTFTGSPGEPEYMNDIDSYVVDSGTSSLTNGSFSFALNSDGSIAFPTLTTTNWEDGTLEGPTLQMGNDPESQVIITGPTPNANNIHAQRLVIQGQQGFGGENNSKGEGGDVYIWAGSGGDGGSINPRGDGGDVKLRGGHGGNNGGYIRIESGRAQANNGYGGFIELNAGPGTGSNSTGGYVNIRSGSGSLEGGDINIIAGIGDTNNGRVRVNVGDGNYQWTFRNDGVLEAPNGTHMGADLVGDGYVAEVGYKFNINVDPWNNQGGSNTYTELELDGSYTGDIAVGDTITFQNGETRVVSNAYEDSNLYVSWSGDPVVSEYNNPIFPLTITSANYEPAVKRHARIKPDLDYAGLGQYMEIYTGGPSMPDELGHIHMKGADGNIELFLGTDDNFVSSKETGNTPGRVTMRSETEVKVIETPLRTSRNGSTFVTNYGDGRNYLWTRNTNNDLSFTSVTTDPDGNYYIGGEHCSWSDATVSKFSKDGELLWSKFSSNTTVAWQVMGIGYDPVTKTVAAAVETDYQRSNSYLKLVTFDAETGEDLEIAQDFYDAETWISIQDMKRHPSLGWVLVGQSYDEDIISANLTPQTGSGVGVLVLDTNAVRTRGMLPDVGDGVFRLQGNNITGQQMLNTAIGLFKSVPVVNVNVDNPDANGAFVNVRVRYNQGDYYGIDSVPTPGSNYNTGDTVKVLGSYLGGVDGTNDVTFTIVSENANGGIVGSSGASGTADVTKIRLDLATIGYTTENFSTGTYNTLYRVGQRPIVLTRTWKKFLDTANNQSTGYGTALDIGSDGNIYVGGYIDSNLNDGDGGGFIWKLNEAGNTQWVNGFNNPWEVNSIAINNTGTTLYVALRGMQTLLVRVNASTGSVVNTVEPYGMFGGSSPFVDTALDDQGEEYVYWGWNDFGAIFAQYSAFAVTKFETDLTTVWSRAMNVTMNGGEGIYTNYDDNGPHFTLTPTQAALVGYSKVMSKERYDAQLWSLSITDDFEPTILDSVNGIQTQVLDLHWQQNNDVTLSDLANLGVTTKNSTVIWDNEVNGLQWIDHHFQSRVLNGNKTVKGIVGVENIKFIEGGNLDHNPADIPQSAQNYQLNGSPWQLTLQLSDRGKFIKNRVTPDIGNCEDLTIFVPSSTDVQFPIGTVITLINLDYTDTYRINVEPVNFGSGNDVARVYCAGESNWSTWAFNGIQTATLMKIAPNDWLLTCNNPINTD